MGLQALAPRPAQGRIGTRGAVASKGRRAEWRVLVSTYRSGDCATNETWLWDGYRVVQTGMTLTGVCPHADDFDLGGWKLPILVKRIIP